ncbi:MAG: ribosomal protein S18-alanine N-acetyltransferase [Chloroflexota bacterium]
MGYVQIARMNLEDVSEVMTIERESFSHTWPGGAYRKELQENKNAHYIVLRCAPEDQRPANADDHDAVARRGLGTGLLRLANRWLLGHDSPAPPSQVTLAGYAGLWLVMDEAHITTIAVRPEFRGRGFGELLLASMVEVALEIGGRWLTLEVRVSNEVAQNLYRKYGFRAAGVRHKYYSDNGEDAVIMWTEELSSPEFQARYKENKDALLARLHTRGDLAP